LTIDNPGQESKRSFELTSDIGSKVKARDDLGFPVHDVVDGQFEVVDDHRPSMLDVSTVDMRSDAIAAPALRIAVGVHARTTRL
jgi:hypothetical protein